MTSLADDAVGRIPSHGIIVVATSDGDDIKVSIIASQPSGLHRHWDMRRELRLSLHQRRCGCSMLLLRE